MKLAPITTARRAPSAKVDDCAAIGQRAQHVNMRLVGARDRQAHRLRTGRQQQAIIGDGLAAGRDDVACVDVDLT